MGPLDLKEFVTGFLIEAEEYLDSTNRNLVAASEALKQNRAEPRAIRELFRSLHTIKGLSSMVGADPIVAISHEMESILRVADKAGGRLSDHTLDLLVQGTRAIEERVGVIAKSGIAAIPVAPASLLEALTLAQAIDVGVAETTELDVLIPADVLKSFSASDREQVAQGVSSNRRVVLIDFQPSPERSEQGFNITSVRERLVKIGEIVKVVPRSLPAAPTGIVFTLILITDQTNDVIREASSTPNESILEISSGHKSIPVPLIFEDFSAEATEWAPTDQSSIRVDIRRLDETMERLSELVITRSKLARVAAAMASRGIDVRDLNAVVAENTRQLKRLRAAITKARMVPLAELLQRLPLVVRGLTKDSEKSVNLNMLVGNAEVDKAVADKIFPAIVHLVRNAVDHAIESREDRKLAKKPEAGTISLICDDSSGTNLVLTLTDDGRGINRQAVAKKAGVNVAENDEELLQQITRPGLSTRDEVTTVSGRGMGMDIVRRTVELLGGQINLASSEGNGTTFVLHVPVSVTIVDILSFVSGDQVFAVPIAMIDEIIEIDSAAVVQSPSLARTGLSPHLIQRRGHAIPFLSLSAVLKKPVGAMPRKALVVNQRRGGTIAFGVDRMIGQQEVVVRPLDETLTRIAGVSGATDLGDGRPTLILDLAMMGAAINQAAVVKL